MPYFKWQGVDVQGRMHEGKSFASCAQELDEHLFSKKIALIKTSSILWQWALTPIRQVHILQFFQQLHNLVSASVRVPDALEISAYHVTHPRLQEIIYTIARRVKMGLSFDVCLQEYPKYFNALHVQSIKAGQESGQLACALKQILDHVTQAHEFNQKLRTVLLMPVITFVSFLIISFVIFISIVPRFIDIFVSMGKPLPSTMQTMQQISICLSSSIFWVASVSVLTLGTMGWLLLCKSRLKKTKDAFVLSIPLCSSLIIQRFNAYFFQSLAMLIQGGVQLDKAIDICKQSIDNTMLHNYLCRLHNAIESGDALDRAMEKTCKNLFGPDVIGMIHVSQKSGALGPVLQQLAYQYNESLQTYLKRITTLAQPLLILLLGLLVTMLIFAVYMPIINVSMAL